MPENRWEIKGEVRGGILVLFKRLVYILRMQIQTIETPLIKNPTVRKVLEWFSLKNASVFFRGGVVRDTIAGIAFRDIDLITSLPLPDTHKMFQNAGAILYPTDDSNCVLAEVDKYLFDVSYSHTPHAVTLDDAYAISKHCDFSINALLMSPAGEVYDFCNSIEHLKEGRIHFINDPYDSISKSPMQIIRYFRFHARYGKGKPDTKIVSICDQLVHRLANESIGIMGRQMFYLLNAPAPPYAVLSIMHEIGILDYAFGFAIKDYSKMMVAEAQEKLGISMGMHVFDLRLASFLLASDMPPDEALAHISRSWEMTELTISNVKKALSILRPDR